MSGSTDTPEARQAKVAEDRLQFDREKEERERRHSFWTRLGVVVPLVAVVVTAIAGYVTQRQQEKQDFKLKAADIVFNTSGPAAAEEKAAALKALFPDDLGSSFATHFNPSAGRVARSDPTVVATVIGLIAAHPNARAEIIRDWKRAFPADTWLPAD